jgi:EAL domain-containing protein (putative c-di-GMP-specific phosphodiesterase class I)
VLSTGALSIVVQPIKELNTLTPIGVEALSRIHFEPIRTPDLWFKEAAEVGLGLRLELAAVAAALHTLSHLPADQFLSINASPETAQAPELADMLQTAGARIVLELTEHAEVSNYETLNLALDRLRCHGVRIAIDDAGAGYAGLQHILKLRPDIIKLDSALTAAIHEDPARRALAAALILFAQDINATIIAEGIETEPELAALQRLGVPWGQGYYLGKPAAIKTSPTDTLQASLRAAR